MPKFMPISTCVSRGGSTLTVRGSWCHLPQHLREGSRDSLRSLHGSFLVARRFGKLQSSNCTGLKSNLPRLGRRFRLGLEPERYLEDLDMFRCRVCGSIGQTPPPKRAGPVTELSVRLAKIIRESQKFLVSSCDHSGLGQRLVHRS